MIGAIPMSYTIHYIFRLFFLKGNAFPIFLKSNTDRNTKVQNITLSWLMFHSINTLIIVLSTWFIIFSISPDRRIRGIPSIFCQPIFLDNTVSKYLTTEIMNEVLDIDSGNSFAWLV